MEVRRVIDDNCSAYAVVLCEDYSKQILAKCLYWYTEDYVVNVERRENEFHIKLYLKEGKIEHNTLYEKLNRDLIDHYLRAIVLKETKVIHELIIAKAFSHGEFDEEPIGNLQDPLGINFFE